jgi:hypothetical protein
VLRPGCCFVSYCSRDKEQNCKLFSTLTTGL